MAQVMGELAPLDRSRALQVIEIHPSGNILAYHLQFPPIVLIDIGDKGRAICFTI
jgi:hypothetical protein